jgi:hypothetical protein
VDNHGKIDDTIYMAVMVNERSKGITTMAQYGLSGEKTIKCVCERCEDVYHIDGYIEDRYSPIVSLSDMKISSEDFVCVTCLTESESIQVDAYITRLAIYLAN